MNADAVLRAAFQDCGIDPDAFHRFQVWSKSLEKQLGIIRQASHPLLAIDVSWDGDSQGWFVRLDAIFGGSLDPSSPFECGLLAISFGGDMHVFNGTVPPWPESRVAVALGTRLAQAWNVPFYFPSPDEPDDCCPRWFETAVTSCRKCRKPLMRVAPNGICHPCYMKSRFGKSRQGME